MHSTGATLKVPTHKLLGYGGDVCLDTLTC